MRIYLVIWEEQDSGFEIKGAFLSKEKADKLALSLNTDALQIAVEDSVAWCERMKLAGPTDSTGRYGPYASLLAMEESLNWFHVEYYQQHSVQEVIVNE